MTDTLRVTRDGGVRIKGKTKHITLFWNLVETQYVAYRTMPGVNQTARLPKLDAPDMLTVFKNMRDFLQRTMLEEFYTTDELD